MSLTRPLTRSLTRSLTRPLVGHKYAQGSFLDRFSTNLVFGLAMDSRIGSKRGTVVESEATYINPSIRAFRSDGAIKSFPQAGLVSALTAWGNEEVVRSDIVFDVDPGELGAAYSVSEESYDNDGVSDGSISKDNVLRLVANANGAGINSASLSLVVGVQYRLTVEMYCPSANTTTTGLTDPLNTDINLQAAGEWTTASVDLTAQNSTLRLRFANSSGAQSSTSGDIVYLAALTLTALNHNATAWAYDISANGNDAVQATVASQPTIMTAGVVNEDALAGLGLSFDGSNDFISYAGTATSATLLHCIVLDIPDGLSDGAYEIIHKTSTTDRLYLLITATGSSYQLEYACGGFTDNTQALRNVAITERGKILVSLVRDNSATTLAIYVDGVEKKSSSTYSAASTAIADNFGEYVNAAPGYFDGDLYAWFTLTDIAQRPAIEAELARIYGITLA